jgi:UTP-glucose-1-phosphate uridylyltransferase
MMKLLILAAGLGSRFGGIKQVAGIGPAGETVLEYSLYDAILAGFDEVVFLIRSQIAEDFASSVLARLPKDLPYELAFQDFKACRKAEAIALSPRSGRTKPWGTGHALLCARPFLDKCPFATINADDYYGRDAFVAMSKFLAGINGEGRKNGEIGRVGLETFSFPGYRLSDVVPKSGPVSRAVCEFDANGDLSVIVEHPRIEWSDSGLRSISKEGVATALKEDAVASMNFWALTPGIFPWAEKMFEQFLAQNASSATAEFWLPSIIEDMVSNKAVRVVMARVENEYFGLTNPLDLETTRARIKSLIEQGVYPASLWKDFRMAK